MATVDELREANAAVGRRRKIMHQASRESAARTRDAVDEMNARRRQRIAGLRATGTDDTTAKPTIVPVRTGFEESAAAARAAQTTVPKRDRKSRDLAEAAAALNYGLEWSEPEPRESCHATLDMLTSVPLIETDSPLTDEGDGEQGTDADQPRPDLLSLVAGNRHEREREANG